MCGVFGLKPTFGTVANWPASAFGFLAHIGPMAATVEDARRLLIAMAGPDARDPSALSDLLSVRPGRDRRALRVGFSPDLGHGEVDREILAAVARAVAALGGAGINVSPVLPGFPDPVTAFHYYWFTGAARLVQAIPAEQRTAMDPGLLEIAAAGSAYPAAAADRAAVELDELKSSVDRLFESIDILITATLPIASVPACAEVPLGWPEPRWTSWTPFTYPFNLTGNPAASINVGWTSEGLPIGAQLVGRRGEDLVVLDLAQLVEEILAPEVASRASARRAAAPVGGA
jgi:aspartyl-tRNA(Asn)/glutamyl-tRNA(Gln) amidotransferase subunit A